jgi:hypothetical protein
LFAKRMLDYALESTRRSLASPRSAVRTEEVVSGDVRRAGEAIEECDQAA